MLSQLLGLSGPGCVLIKTKLNEVIVLAAAVTEKGPVQIYDSSSLRLPIIRVWIEE